MKTPHRWRPATPARRARRLVVALSRVHGPRRVARGLRLCERSVIRWRRGWARNRLREKRRGPAPARATSIERLAVRAYLRAHGGLTGVESLKKAFGSLARRELMRLKRAWVAQRARVALRYASVLAWQRPGFIWAADFTDLSEPTASGERAMLVVRDLASHALLWTRPCRRQDARTLCEALEHLIALHGAPLLLKIDNGKALHARRVRELLWRHGVALLLSPVRRPQYNGACESGLGWFKRRVDDVARDDGGLRAWSADDVEAARVRSNASRCPWGASGPTPAERFGAKEPVTQPDRDRFRAAVACARKSERTRRDPLREGRHRAAVERAAIRRALVDLGLLTIRTRRVSPAISPLFSDTN